VNFGGGALADPPVPARWEVGCDRFRGYVWGENVGWINLHTGWMFVAAPITSPVPAVADWAVLVLVGLWVTAGVLLIRHRRATATA